jgi:lysyl-tRNA synthetase class 2
MKENNNGAQVVEDENKLVALRREKLQVIRAKREAYPNTFQRESTAQLLIAEYGEKEKSQLEELAAKTMIAGRIIRMRGPFVVITDGGVKIQLYVNKKDLSETLAN